MRVLTIGGRSLRVTVRDGAAGWTPLLLCNGIGASLELLQPFVDELDPRRPVIRFDMPGIGGSPAPVIPYHLATLPSLLAGMLDQLGYAQADVLGISWGGGVAQHFAAFHRSSCRRLVLVSTGTGALMVPAKPAVLARMVTPRRYLDRGYLQQVAPILYGGSARTQPQRVAAAMHAHSRVGSPTGYVYQLLAGAGWTSLPFLPLLRQPTLVVAGDDDPIIPLVNARVMQRLIPDARLHVYQGGHLGLVTEAAELAPVVEQFLR